MVWERLRGGGFKVLLLLPGIWGIFSILTIYIYTLEVQDQRKTGANKGFPTTNGQGLVFGLPGPWVYNYNVFQTGLKAPTN